MGFKLQVLSPKDPEWRYFMCMGRLSVNCKFWKQIEVMLHNREHCDLCLFAGVDTVTLYLKTPA